MYTNKQANKQTNKEGDEEADRGNDGKTTSKSGLALNGMSYFRKREPRGVEEAGCKIYNGAPTVSQTTGQIRTYIRRGQQKGYDLVDQDVCLFNVTRKRAVKRRKATILQKHCDQCNEGI